MTERSDPLAPPEGYGASRAGAPSDGRDGRCGFQTGPRVPRCGKPAEMTIWFGCTTGEHAGPVEYCQQHGEMVLGIGSAICARCQKQGTESEMKILKTDPPDAGSAAAQSALERFFG